MKIVPEVRTRSSPRCRCPCSTSGTKKQNFAEIEHPDYPCERKCRPNPALAESRKLKREGAAGRNRGGSEGKAPDLRKSGPERKDAGVLCTRRPRVRGQGSLRPVYLVGANVQHYRHVHGLMILVDELIGRGGELWALRCPRSPSCSSTCGFPGSASRSRIRARVAGSSSGWREAREHLFARRVQQQPVQSLPGRAAIPPNFPRASAAPR